MTVQPARPVEEPTNTSIDKPNNSFTSSQRKFPHADPFPPLNSGDRLSRAEFERRYSAQPEIKKAELIEGVVYVSSPVRTQQHGVPHSHIILWLGTYCAATPGLHLTDNSTLRLDVDNEPQPDVAVWIDEKLGGQAQIADDDYLTGAPELIVEVAASSAAYDLHEKRNVYRRNGVREYLVLLPYEQLIIWYTWHEGEYVPLTSDEIGILRSQIFPGLYLQPSLFWSSDLAGLLALLQQGISSPEHAAFVAQLANKQKID
jgi:Uma2 family endonuclease